MYDISTPTDSYQKEISKLKVQIKAVDNNSELNSGIFQIPAFLAICCHFMATSGDDGFFRKTKARKRASRNYDRKTG